MKAGHTITVEYSLKHFDRYSVGIIGLMAWLSRAVPGRGIQPSSVLNTLLPRWLVTSQYHIMVSRGPNLLHWQLD